MNIKKLTLIATAVSALSLSPLTYARTESTDMSIIGIEPECSYFADLRFNASPFGSKGDIVANKDSNSKFEFDKFSWGGSAGFGTEVTPGFEVSLVASFMTNIGTDSASSTSVSSSSSSTTTPASSTTSGIKLTDKHRDAYNSWLRNNPDVSNFLTNRLEKDKLHELLAQKDYNIRSASILGATFKNTQGLANGVPELINAHETLLRHYSQLDGKFYNTLQQGQGPEQQNYASKLANLLAELRDQLGNNNTRQNISNLISIKREDGTYVNDQDRFARLTNMYNAAFANAGVNLSVTNAHLQQLRQYNYQAPPAADQVLSDALRITFAAIGNMADALVPNANGTAEIIMNNISLGIIRHGDTTPPGVNYNNNGERHIAPGARTAANMYAFNTAADTPSEDIVRQAFFYRQFVVALRVFSDMMALSDQNVRTQLDAMVANIFATQKGTPEYKKLIEQFDAQLKQSNITDRKAEDIIDAIAAEAKAQEAKAKADEKANDKKTTDTTTDKDKTTASTKQAIDVNLTKFRVGVEGGVRLLEFGSGSLSVIAGVGATAVTGTVANEDTGWMFGAEVYGGVKGEYAISESMAITARYTYTPALFSGSELNDNVQAKVKTLGYEDGATMSSLSMHELSAGIRFYF